jgi:hypothetical protein
LERLAPDPRGVRAHCQRALGRERRAREGVRCPKGHQQAARATEVVEARLDLPGTERREPDRARGPHQQRPLVEAEAVARAVVGEHHAEARDRARWQLAGGHLLHRGAREAERVQVRDGEKRPCERSGADGSASALTSCAPTNARTVRPSKR